MSLRYGVALLFALGALLGDTGGPTRIDNGQAQPNTTLHRTIFWINCDHLLRMTGAELRLWKARGVGGFVCMAGRLHGMGGSRAFDATPKADLSAGRYAFQRRLRNTRIARRIQALGLKAYLGVFLVNTYNPRTPLREWFDDRGWAEEVIPRMRQVAGVARRYGFAGLAFDGELYPQLGGRRTASWESDYLGHTQAAGVTRAKAKQRGRQLMTAILGAFPRIELVNYWLEFPESWQAFAQGMRRGRPGYFSDSLMPSFWDGISSVKGYAAIRFYDHAFYKSPLLGEATWDAANQYNANAWYSSLSRRWSNWRYAASRFHLTPFVWIDAGTDTDEVALPASYVGEQIQAARRWSTGREFGNFVQNAPSSFDYGPYVPALQSAARPDAVDSVPPELVLSSPVGLGTSFTTRRFLELRGSATDNLAVRAVHWRNDRAGGGVGRMTWRILGGDYRTGYTWRMDWSVARVPLELGLNRITLVAVDIKGLTRRLSLSVTRGPRR